MRHKQHTRRELGQRRAAFGPWDPPYGGRGRGGGRGGRRARRGNVRAAILALLAERPMHGYEMIQELGGRTGGVWRPSPGSVYPTLQLLEDEGLVTSEETAGKRLFSLTDTGRAEVEQQTTAPWDEVTEGAGESELHVHDAMRQLMLATRQVMHAGTEDQRARALEILVDTRRRLYGILAEDTAPESE